MSDITLQDVFKAQQRITTLARRTPLVLSPALSDQTGATVYLKLETLQPTGSFKVRGASNFILKLPAEERSCGIVTVSTGNHGRAVAYVAQQVGIEATVCLSELVPANKLDALKRLDANVIVVGRSQDDAMAHALELVERNGAKLVHPFDDPDIIIGQATIGLEILQDFPQVDIALVPLSGGGLISGIAMALKAANPAIQVIGISMEYGPAMYHSLQAGHPVLVEEQESLADSLGGGIGLDNRYTFEMVKQHVDDVVLVSEEEIGQAMAWVAHEHQLIVEGAGAVGIAALLNNKVNANGRHIALVLSGGNVATPVLMKIVQKYGD